MIILIKIIKKIFITKYNNRIESLEKYLLKNEIIEILNLMGISLNFEFMKHLQPGFEKNKSLVSINLTNNEFKFNISEIITESLQQN